METPRAWRDRIRGRETSASASMTSESRVRASERHGPVLGGAESTNAVLHPRLSPPPRPLLIQRF
ncbi:unnamed protein product, partial [Musa acuminata subsp. burmannicoides]